MSKSRIKTASDQRAFTMVYNDFLHSDVLSPTEKMLFIYLKMHSGNGTGQSFPSLATLAKETGLSKRTVQRWLAEMEDKGVITKEHRMSSRGNQSNLYTIRDNARIWNAKDRIEMQSISSDLADEEMISYLKTKGYDVIKKEPVSGTDQSSDTSASSELDIVLTTDKSTAASGGSQERYSLDDVRELFDYAVLISGKNADTRDIDSVIEILYDTLNTAKKTLRVAGQDRPAMVVISKLMRLNYEEILYSIQKFKGVTERINNPKAYMLTILYSAKEQMHLDIGNQVNHDLYGWTDDTD